MLNRLRFTPAWQCVVERILRNMGNDDGAVELVGKGVRVIKTKRTSGEKATILHHEARRPERLNSSIEQRDSRRGERHAMFLAHLDALGRHDPQAGLEVKFRPCGAAYFAGEGGGENGEFQRTRRRANLFAQNAPISRQRAGFSPWRYLLTVARSRIFSMRPRRRVAVSVLVSRIGPGTLTTKAVSISATGSVPMIGLA